MKTTAKTTPGTIHEAVKIDGFRQESFELRETMKTWNMLAESMTKILSTVCDYSENAVPHSGICSTSKEYTNTIMSEIIGTGSDVLIQKHNAVVKEFDIICGKYADTLTRARVALAKSTTAIEFMVLLNTDFDKALANARNYFKEVDRYNEAAGSNVLIYNY